MISSVWKKGLLLGIILLFMGTSIFPSINGDEIVPVMDGVIQNKISYTTKCNYDRLDQFQLDFSTYWGWGITRSQHIAQSFIPSLPNLTKVALLISHQYTDIRPGIFISIRSDLNDSDLTSIVVDCTDIPYFKELNWTIIDIPDISVVPGNTYYIIVRVAGEAEYAGYSTDFLSNDPYSRGEAWLAYWEGYPPNLFWHSMSTPGRCIDFAFKTYGLGSGNEPPSIPIITGPVEGKVNIASDYNLVATDPEGDDVYYFIDWQDNTSSGWIGPYPSGEEITESHTWSTEREYMISVRAKDTNGNEGDWATHTVTMPYSYNPLQQFFNWLFHRLPMHFYYCACEWDTKNPLSIFIF